MNSVSVWLFALLATCCLSAPVNPPSNSSLIIKNGDCYDYDIPITTRTYPLTWIAPKFTTNYDVAAFFNALFERDPDHSPVSNPGNTTSKTYTIHATFCSPKLQSRTNVVLLATSGLGYDSRYWASQFKPSEYSFVEYALAKGYSTFIYDRLGTGQSTKVSGYSDSQAATALDVLAKLTALLKQGRFTLNPKIIHIGHSYGSFLTHSLIAQTPDLSDGVILTGIGYNSTAFDFPGFISEARLNIADTVYPGRYPDLDSGYLTFSDIYGNAASFFHEGHYNKEVLWYTQEIGQPLAAIELVTGNVPSLATAGPIPFTGPVLLLTGEFDVGNCAGNCNGILEYPARDIFNQSRLFEAAIHPGSGHGISFNLNATGAYSVMVDFLGKSGF